MKETRSSRSSGSSGRFSVLSGSAAEMPRFPHYFFSVPSGSAAGYLQSWHPSHLLSCPRKRFSTK